MKKEFSLSYLGESYVHLELAKRNLKVSKLFAFPYDFLGWNGSKLEVKSALPSFNRTYKKKVDKTYEYKEWQFRITSREQQNSDFFVCVVFENLSKPPLGYFIFPKEIIKTSGKSNMLSVFESDLRGKFKKINKENKYQYLNNWKPILEFNM